MNHGNGSATGNHSTLVRGLKSTEAAEGNSGGRRAGEQATFIDRSAVPEGRAFRSS